MQSTFSTPQHIAFLSLSLLQTEAYTSLVRISSEFVKDRFTFLNGEQHVAAFQAGFLENPDSIYNFFTWQHDNVIELVRSWDPTDADFPSEHSQALFRKWDVETLQALVPFTAGIGSMRERTGVVILLYAGNDKWVFHNIIEPADYVSFCGGWRNSVAEAKEAFKNIVENVSK
ncbi:hypothetical protein HK096_004467, partial [Nowakowskiella sp. JEL0078]